jgi:hypothetical protein
MHAQRTLAALSVDSGGTVETTILGSDDICRILRVSPRKLRMIMADPEAQFPPPFTLPNTRRQLWLASSINDYVLAAAKGARVAASA